MAAVVVLVLLVPSLTPSGGGGPPTSLTVAAVRPRQGPASGGTIVTITGTGFLREARRDDCAPKETVYFGSDERGDYPIPAAPGSVKVVSNTTIKAMTPENYGGSAPGSARAGTVDVQVYSPRCGLSAPHPPHDHYFFTYNKDGQCLSSTCHLTVDGPIAAGSLGHVAAGFLNGFTDLAGADQRATLPAVEMRALKQLHPRWWRFGSPSQGVSGRQVSRQMGVLTTELVESDYLAAYPGQEPWSDLSRFYGFVQRDVQRYEAAGMAPNYWDIWNEPGCRYRRDGRPTSSSGTVNDYLSIYGTAYKAIRSVDPRAQIIGPSVGSINTHTSPGSVCGDDLTIADFLRWAAFHNYYFAALSYHDEAEAPPPEDPDAPFARDDYRVGALGAHVLALRRLIAKDYPRLSGMKIFVNEYGSWATLEPGWLVGAFASLEGADVTEANLTCGGVERASCRYLVDGLFANTAGTPAMPYWVFADYAKMTGSRVTLTSDGTNLSGVATRQDSADALEILVGRHDECAGPPRPYYNTSGGLPPAPDDTCPEFQVPPSPASPVSTTLTIKEPYSLSRVNVTVQRLPNSATCEGTAPGLPPGCTTASIPTAPPTLRSVTTVVNGLVSVPLGFVRDGDAVFVTITPSPGAPTAPAR